MGALLFFCALIFYYFSGLRIDYRNSDLLYLGYADPAQYFAQARALLKHSLPSIQIGDGKLPPMYPIGYPALMLPWLKILPETDSILRPIQDESNTSVSCCSSAYSAFIFIWPSR